MEKSLFINTLQDRDAVVNVTPDVMDELDSCFKDLHAICGDDMRQWKRGSRDGHDVSESDNHSAAEIASECLALLESLSITTDESDDDDRDDGADAINCSLASSPTTETALLQEMDDLGSELQALMAALCSPQADDIKLEMNSPANNTTPVETPLICTSPKMVALTQHLQRRPSTQKMLLHTALRRHKSFLLPLRSPSSAKTKQKSEKANTSLKATLSDAACWRQFQSKSLQRHLTRQSQARTNQQREKEKDAKAVEYRYRRVSKPCYPLAKHMSKSMEVDADHLKETLHLPGAPVSTRTKKSYIQRFTATTKPAADFDPKKHTNGLLCGVYLHSKRRSNGMLYLTCTTIEQLKARVAQHFSLAQPIVNLYREQIATNTSSGRERKYLHRVVRFRELRDGDLLCATTSGYDDMAILCAWMKKRQQMIHHYKSPQKPIAAPAIKAHMMPKAQKKAAEPRDVLTYKPPPAPTVKVWDANGRVVSICQRLPLAE